MHGGQRMNDLYLIAHIAGRVVAIESTEVESVVDMGEVTPIPLSERHVIGLATLRSRVVTVIDTTAALTGVTSEGQPRRAIVSVIDGHHYAFAVDALEDVAAFVPQPLDGATEGRWAQAARGVIERDGEPVLIIELSPLVTNLSAAAVD
jgi:purine-binding chemotaxis protein CheW